MLNGTGKRAFSLLLSERFPYFITCPHRRTFFLLISGREGGGNVKLPNSDSMPKALGDLREFLMVSHHTVASHTRNSVGHQVLKEKP